MVKLIENIISNTLVHKHKSKYLSLSKNKRLRSEWALLLLHRCCNEHQGQSSHTRKKHLQE